MHPPQQHPAAEQIVAAYADGIPVEHIAAAHGLTPAQIEQIVAGAEPEPEPIKQPVPAPIVAAVILITLTGVIRTFTIPNTPGIDGWWAAGTALIALTLHVLVAYGLWRRQTGCQWIAVIFGGLTVVTGLTAGGGGSMLGVAAGAAVVGLLLIPESSRAWFRR